MRSHSSRAASAWRLLLLASTALAARSTTDGLALGLHWSDPSQLSPTTEQDFDSRLTERLGRPAFSVSAVEHTLSVSWRGTPEQCQVELSLVHGSRVEGTRLIESPSGDCGSLVPALLTVAALLVESRQSALSSEVTPPAPQRPAPTEPPPTPPAPPPTSAASEPLVLVSVGGALSAGFVPKLELGPAAAVAWAPMPHLRFGVAGALFWGHQYGAAPGLSLSHGRGALLVCGMPLRSSFGLGLCGNVGLHHFAASGISLPRVESHRLITWSVGAELRAEWRLTRRLWWVGHAGADFATRPLYFYYVTASGASKNLFEQRRVNPSLLLALSLELP